MVWTHIGFSQLLKVISVWDSIVPYGDLFGLSSGSDSGLEMDGWMEKILLKNNSSEQLIKKKKKQEHTVD